MDHISPVARRYISGLLCYCFVNRSTKCWQLISAAVFPLEMESTASQSLLWCHIVEHHSHSSSVTVTVTEALVLRPILEDRGRITESLGILVTVDRIEEKCVQIHACGAATEKALLPICRRVRGTTRLPHDKARSVDRPEILAADVSRSEIYSDMCPRSD